MKLPLLRSPFWLGLVLLAGCTNTQPAVEEAPLVVAVAQITEGKAVAYEDFTGRTAAIESVDVKARVTGYLDKVPFKEGDEVEVGQVLYEIDPRPYQAAVQNAQGTLASAKAALQKTEADLDRVRRLRIGVSISREEYDLIVANRDQAAAQVTSAEAALRDAELNLGFCTIKAPIAGRISRTLITAGNLVKADQTSLTSIVRMDPLWAYFDVDEQTLLRIQQMIREEISEAGVTKAGEYLREHQVDAGTVQRAVEIIRGRLTPENRNKLDELLESKLDVEGRRGLQAILDANPVFQSYREAPVPVYLGTRIGKGYPHVGHIDFTDNRLDPTTGTLRVRGVFPNKHRILTPNLSVRIRVPLGSPRRAILVSEAAIVTDQDRKFLFVVNENNEVEQRPVVLGPLYEGMRIIEGGVAVGEWVAVSNLQRVRAGMTVTRKEVPMPKPPRPEDVTPPPPPIVHPR